jgi:H+-transporting ATPase
MYSRPPRSPARQTRKTRLTPRYGQRRRRKARVSEATVYVLRERGHFWSSRPAAVMLFASSADVAIVAYLAIMGVLMTPLAPTVVAMLFIATLAFAFALDTVKLAVFASLPID